MSRKNIKNCLAFARKVKRLLPEDFWTSGIIFYSEGTLFAHKSNPCDQAKCQRSMVWRERCEGFNCTSKGKKSGTGGAMAHFIVTIAHGKGVVLCEQYVERCLLCLLVLTLLILFGNTFMNHLSTVPNYMGNSSCKMVTLGKTQWLLKGH